MVFFNLYCFEISMQNLTDNVIRNAIRLRLGKFAKPFSVEVLFYFYLAYRYLGFLVGLMIDTTLSKKKVSFKEGKNVSVRELIYGFNSKANIDLTIIVPAYNVENYIEKCINSILKQDIKCSFEILIINDCSTDKTKEILNAFIDNHCIRVFDLKVNQGLSAARNVGILNSLGRYLMFLDSDDLLCGNCIQKSYEEIIKNNLDIIEFSFLRFQDDETIDLNSIKMVSEPVVVTEYNEILSQSTGYAWGKIYKRELFENIRFPEGVLFEDGIIHKLVFRLCTKYMHLGCVGYLYRDAPNSITKSIKNKNLVWDHLYMIKYCIDEAERLNFPIDNLFFRQIVLESGLMMKNRSFYLDSKDLLFVFSRLTDFFNQYDKGFDLTIREKIIVWCIKKKYINAWKWVAF